MSDTTQARHVYAVYLTAATETQAVGTVVNRAVWTGDGAWEPPAGQAIILDDGCDHPIGSIYTATTS